MVSLYKTWRGFRVSLQQLLACLSCELSQFPQKKIFDRLCYEPRGLVSCKLTRGWPNLAAGAELGRFGPVVEHRKRCRVNPCASPN